MLNNFHNLTLEPSANQANPYSKTRPWNIVNYHEGYNSPIEMKLKLLAIKENKERGYPSVITDAVEGSAIGRNGSYATAGFVFNDKRYLEPENIPEIRKVLLSEKFGFIQEFVVNSESEKYIKSNLTYHELFVKFDDKNIPIAAAMIMSCNDITSCYDLEIIYIGDVTFGLSIKESIDKYLNLRKFLPTISTARQIISYGPEESVSFRDEVIDDVAEMAHRSFYPWMKVSVGDFSRAYIESNAALLLLYGPTGTGKTTFLRTMAIELNAVMMVTSDVRVASSAALFETYKDYIKRAKASSDPRPHILVIEDVDVLLMSRMKNNREMSRLLNETKGIASNKDIRIILTTNVTDLSEMDSAMLRPGRCFDKLHFRKLTIEEALEVRKDLKYENIDISKMAKDNEVSLAEAIEEIDPETNLPLNDKGVNPERPRISNQYVPMF